MRYDGLTKDQVIDRNIEFLKKVRPDLNRKKRKVLAHKHEKMKFYEDKKHLEWFDKYQKDYNSENFGIYSLSEDCNNIVMWSHYANSHRGVCIGFDTTKLMESFNDIYEQSGYLIDLYKVKYSDEYPTYRILDFDNKIEERIVKPLITKSKYWCYEKEYRLILLNGVDLPIRLYDGIITKVILGCRINSVDRSKIQNIIKDHKLQIEILQAEKKDNYFGLDFKNINSF